MNIKYIIMIAYYWLIKGKREEIVIAICEILITERTLSLILETLKNMTTALSFRL